MYGRGVIMGLTVAALLTGCSGAQNEGATLPSVTESATSAAAPSTPTPTPTASTPGAISEAEALALAKKYFEAMTQVAHEGSGFERFEELTHPTCAPCKEQAERLRRLTQGGRRVVGGDVQVVDTLTDSLLGGTALIRVTTRALPGTVVDGSGEVVDRLPEEDLVDQVLTIAVTPEGIRVVDVLDLGARAR
jgi:hypothetical protein